MKRIINVILIFVLLLAGCTKLNYTSATVIRPSGSNCANYLLSINGNTYATYSIPYKDTAVGSTFFLSYAVGGTASGGMIDSVQCYLSGKPIHYPYIEITKIYE